MPEKTKPPLAAAACRTIFAARGTISTLRLFCDQNILSFAGSCPSKLSVLGQPGVTVFRIFSRVVAVSRRRNSDLNRCFIPDPQTLRMVRR